MSGRVISWFSCGAASAVASKLAIKEHGEVEVIYNETHSEHEDNERFLSDCESWFGQKVIRLSSDKAYDIWEVFEQRRYLAGVHGAPCTAILKRIPSEKYLNHGFDLEVFGYTVDEPKRIQKFKENNPERRTQMILEERGLTKDDCLGMIAKVGIEIPTMYKLGYTHNNCIGCVKAEGMGYWNKIRVDFPDVFERMSKLERKFNAAVCKRYEGKKRIRVFLDELDPKAGNHLTEAPITCGLMCEIEVSQLEEEEKIVMMRASQ